MEQVTSTPRLPVELRAMIWNELRPLLWNWYEVASKPALHVITPKEVGMTPNICYRAISLPTPGVDDDKIMRNLIQVNRELRYTMLNGREVFQFSRPVKDIASFYPWDTYQRHEPIPTRPFARYSSLIVDWERDVFYFPFLHDNKDLNPVLQDPKFQAKVRHIAFNGLFPRGMLSQYRATMESDFIDPREADAVTRNSEILSTQTRSLTALQTIRLVHGLMVQDEQIPRWMPWRRLMTYQGLRADQYGFCNATDVSIGYALGERSGAIAINLNPMGPVPVNGPPYVHAYYHLETDISSSMLHAKPVIPARVGHTGSGATASNAIKLGIVLDHLGEWDFEYQFYRRNPNYGNRFVGEGTF
ncbi:hypothetical protein G7054_g13645 [Neopestalotiopsis clavispora]|nr:hypothetical protein G7054_g13645 [Neopestalotiopsis clavispora]